DLAHMKRKPAVESPKNRQCGKDRIIAGTPGDDDFGAVIERLHQGLYPHLSADGTAPVDDFFRQRLFGTDILDPAGSDAALEISLVQFGVDDCHTKGQALLLRDLFDDGNGLRERLARTTG